MLEFSVSGTSTVRSWTCTVQGQVSLTPGSATPIPGFANGVQTATLTVPVKGFSCPNEEMTQHLHESMKTEQFPNITFRLEKYEVAGARAQAVGSVTILDVTAPVTLPISLKADGPGVAISGNTRLDMTKFGVEPPVVMLGLLKVGPQVRIDFKGVVRP